MRQTADHRRRREAFMSGVLLLARPDATVTPGGTPNGADLVTVRIGTQTITGRSLVVGFGVLWDDLTANRRQTQLAERGVTSKWRDNMIHARRISDLSLVTPDDARRLLALSL